MIADVLMMCDTCLKEFYTVSIDGRVVEAKDCPHCGSHYIYRIKSKGY